MLAWLTALAWIGGFQDARPDADRRPDDALDVRQMFVPLEILDKFRDPASAYQAMGYEAFLNLLRDADAALLARRFVGPTAGTITGRVDVEGRRVVGASSWSFPKGHGGSVELWPWNLRVLAVRQRGRSQRPDWGLTADGALLVRGLPDDARQIDVDWELPGDFPDRRWTIRGQTPKCASSRIQLDYPTGWSAWAPASFEGAGLAPETKRIETRSSGESSWTVEFAPAGLIDMERPLLSWRGESTFKFGPVRTDVELRAVVQVDREGAPRLRIRLPASLSRLALGTVGASAHWHRAALPDGGVEWTAEFRRPPLGSVQLVAAGSLPTPAGKPWPLESVLVPDALFRGERVEVVVDPALRLIDLDAAGLARKEVRVEAGAGRWQFAGFAGTRRPAVHLGGRRPEIEVQTRHFLDVGRERVRWAARVDWSCVRGELSTPTLLVPAGWKLQKATVEPAARARAAATAEAGHDGRTRVAVPLTRPLTTGERLRVVALFERPAAGWTPAGGSEVALPEAATQDAARVGVAAYSVRLDPNLPLRLTGEDPQWAAAPDVAGAPPAAWNWDGEVTRFQYFAPLAGAALRGTESRRLLFDADVLHVVQDLGNFWESRATFNCVVRSGEAGWVELESLGAVPADTRWSWNGVEEAGGDVQAAPAPQHPGRTRMRVPLRAAADGRVSLQASWRSNDPMVEPTTFRVLDADRSTVRAVVLSNDPGRLRVFAKGWTETPSEPTSGDAFDPSGVRWSGRLERADADASLRVSRAEAAADRVGGEVHGTIDVSGPRRRRVFHASLDVDAKGAAPLALTVPGNAKLRSAWLGGQPVAAWIHAADAGRGVIQFAEPVPRGCQRVEVVFDAEVAAEAEVATPGIAEPWRPGRLLWRIGTSDVVWNPHGDRRLLGGLEWRPAEDSGVHLDRQAERAGRGEDLGFAARRAARLLRLAPETLGLDQAEDVADALVLLQRRLPEGWMVVAERFAAGLARAAGEPSPPPRTVEEWLTSIGLHSTIGANVLLLTRRPLAAAVDGDGSRIDPGAFAESKAEALRSSGAEPWGAFIPVSQLEFAGDPTGRGGVSAGSAAADNERATFYFLGDGRPLAAAPPEASAVRAASSGGFAAGMAVALLGLLLRRGPVVIGAAAVAHLSAGGSHQAVGVFLSAAAWGLATAAAAGLLFQIARRLKPAAALAVLTLWAAPSPGNDERTALVPFDPKRLDAPLTSVEVPEPLLRRLRNLADGRPTPFLLSSADYQGRVVGDHVEWQATLAALVFAKEPPVKAPIGFIGVEVQSLEAEGRPAGFLPPTAALPLVATLSASPRQTLTLRFRTPIIAEDLGSTVEFPLPAAAQQSFVISGFAKPVELVRTPEARSFTIKENGTRIVGARGPSALLQVIWRERASGDAPPAMTVAASLKPEGKSGAWEAQTHFHWDAGQATQELSIPVPVGVVIRRVEGAGLTGWTLTTSAAGVRQVKASLGPSAAAGALTVHAWFLPSDPRDFSPPLLFPEGVSVRGVAGVAPPDDGGLEVAASRGVGELPPAAFRDEWRLATTYQPPEAVAKAFAFTDRDHAIRIRARPAPEPWRVSQEHSVRVAPPGKAASWSAAFRFTSTVPVDAAAFAVPPGFRVEQIESASLFQWFQAGDRLTLRLAQPMTGAWVVQGSGRLTFPERGDAAEPPPTVTPFRPLAGAAGATSWSLAGEGGLEVALAGDLPPSCRVQRSKGEYRVEGPTEDASVSFRVVRTPPKLAARQMVVVRRRGGRWDCQGTIEVRSEGGRTVSWEVLTPGELGAVEWTAPGLRVTDAGAREGFRRWLVESRTTDAASAERFTMRWRSTAGEGDARRTLETPAARIPAAAAHERWLAQASSEEVETTAEGFTAEPVPDWARSLAAELNGEQNVKVWRSADPSHRITFSAPEQSRTTARPKVGGWVDAAVAKTGRCRGRAVWWIDAADERLTVFLPSGCDVLAVRVDGRPSAIVPAGEQSLPVRLDPRARRSQVELEWSAPGTELPFVRDADARPTLVRLRSPFGYESSSQTVARSEWLARLLERECDGWLARSAASSATEPEDRTGLAFLYQEARESAGGAAPRVEAVWSAFIDKVTAARGKEAALRLANVSAARGEYHGPRLDPSDAGLVVDHFDFPGTPELPAALDAPRPGLSRPRSVEPWFFALTLAFAAFLSWFAAKRLPPEPTPAV